MIYILIPTFRRYDLTLQCIKSIYSQSYKKFHIIIIDDQSDDPRYNNLKAFESLTLLKTSGDKYWGGTMNVGLDFVQRFITNLDYVLMLNNDTVLPKNYLLKLSILMEQGKKKIIGSVTMAEKSDVIQSTAPIAIKYGAVDLLSKITLQKFNSKKYHIADYLSGRGTIYPAIAIKLIKIIPSYLPHYYGDYIFSHKLRKLGYELQIYPSIYIRNTETFSNQENKSIYWSKKSIDYIPAKIYFILSTENTKEILLYILIHIKSSFPDLRLFLVTKYPKIANMYVQMKNNWSTGKWKHVLFCAVRLFLVTKYPKIANMYVQMKNNWSSVKLTTLSKKFPRTFRLYKRVRDVLA